MSPAPKRTWLWWSSGKDSAWSLHTLRQGGEFQVEALVTTVNGEFDRVAMHAVRLSLLREQACSAGVPLRIVSLPFPCSNAQYEAAVAPELGAARQAGISHMAFGDLFLEDVRDYRLKLLDGSGLEPIFPLWGRETGLLAKEMVTGGLRATLTCVDPSALGREFAGRSFDDRLLAELPDAVDPCGERGEFHTFATAGPMFEDPIHALPGPVVERDGFVFADLLPGNDRSPR